MTKKQKHHIPKVLKQETENSMESFAERDDMTTGRKAAKRRKKVKEAPRAKLELDMSDKVNNKRKNKKLKEAIEEKAKEPNLPKKKKKKASGEAHKSKPPCSPPKAESLTSKKNKAKNLNKENLPQKEKSTSLPKNEAVTSKKKKAKNLDKENLPQKEKKKTKKSKQMPVAETETQSKKSAKKRKQTDTSSLEGYEILKRSKIESTDSEQSDTDSSHDYMSSEEHDIISSNYSDSSFSNSEDEYYNWKQHFYDEETEDDYDFMDDEEDYQLPEDVPEDLFIHQGTALKRKLHKNDNVKFESDNEEAQIIELPLQKEVKCIAQPVQYQLQELLKLEISIASKQFELHTKDCPQLVPIADLDETTYDSDEESGNDTEEDCEETGSNSVEDVCSKDGYVVDSDCDSLNSEDVNSKYLASTDESDDEDVQALKMLKKMRADVLVLKHKVDVANPLANNVEQFQEQELDELPSAKICKHNQPADAQNAEVISTSVIVEPEQQENNGITTEAQTTTQTPTQTVRPIRAIVSTSEAASEEQSLLPEKPFQTVFFNAINSNHVLVLLKDALYIYGTVRLTLIAGEIEIYGHQPQIDVELEVFSPRGYSSVSITPKTCSYVSQRDIELKLKQLELQFSRNDLEQAAAIYCPQYDALLLLERNVKRKKMVNNFKKFMSENVFPNINSMQTGDRRKPHYASEHMLHCAINSESQKALRLPTAWQILQLQSQSRMLLVGGKSVGKSTLLRVLLNRHLLQHKRILLIDLDIGQPELFVPQTVSCAVLTQPLLGPGVFLQQQPAKAYMVGHVNLVLCAHAYLSAVRQLLQHCHAQPEYAHMPWLINTMGYNKGFALELMKEICAALQPTDVVQLESKMEINNFDIELQPAILAATPAAIYIDEADIAASYEFNYQLHVIPTAVSHESRYKREWDMSPKDMRYAMFVSRLSEALQGNAEWLTDCTPLCAPLNSLKVINSVSNECTQDELLKAIEANLVFLCVYTADDAPLECLGIGVVRCIDFISNEIYLLPAMHHERMRSVNCLAIGEMPMPTSMFTNQGPRVKNVAPFMYNTVDDKATKSIKQIYHRPAKFLQQKPKELSLG